MDIPKRSPSPSVAANQPSVLTQARGAAVRTRSGEGKAAGVSALPGLTKTVAVAVAAASPSTTPKMTQITTVRLPAPDQRKIAPQRACMPGPRQCVTLVRRGARDNPHVLRAFVFGPDGVLEADDQRPGARKKAFQLKTHQFWRELRRPGQTVESYLTKGPIVKAANALTAADQETFWAWRQDPGAAAGLVQGLHLPTYAAQRLAHGLRAALLAYQASISWPVAEPVLGPGARPVAARAEQLVAVAQGAKQHEKFETALRTMGSAFVARWASRLVRLAHQLELLEPLGQPCGTDDAQAQQAVQWEAVATWFAQWASDAATADADCKSHQTARRFVAEGLSDVLFGAALEPALPPRVEGWDVLVGKRGHACCPVVAEPPKAWRRGAGKLDPAVVKAHKKCLGRIRTTNRRIGNLAVGTDHIRLRYGGFSAGKGPYQPGPHEVFDAPFNHCTNGTRVNAVYWAMVKAEDDVRRGAPTWDAEKLQYKLFGCARYLGKESYHFPAAAYMNFARWVRERYLDGARLVAFDPCAGWGNRLFGAMSLAATGELTAYYGCDPNSEMTEAYQRIIRECSAALGLDATHFGVERAALERADLSAYETGTRTRPNFIFTSPPYGGVTKPIECYSNDVDQSRNSYATNEDWRAGFLDEALVGRCESILQPGGVLAINITDTPNTRGDCAALLDAAKKRGLRFLGVMGLELGGNQARKSEPIFVFQKPKPVLAPGALADPPEQSNTVVTCAVAHPLAGIDDPQVGAKRQAPQTFDRPPRKRRRRGPTPMP